MSGEWKAWDTARWRQAMPRLSSCIWMRSRPACSPESTVALAALIAPMPTPGSSATSSAASYGVAQVAIMPPPEGRYCMRAPRTATSLAASDSERAPAIVAAANSPMP